MLKAIAIYAAVIIGWYLMMNSEVEPFKGTGLTWLAALVVGAVFVIGFGIIDAIKGKK